MPCSCMAQAQGFEVIGGCAGSQPPAFLTASYQVCNDVPTCDTQHAQRRTCMVRISRLACVALRWAQLELQPLHASFWPSRMWSSTSCMATSGQRETPWCTWPNNRCVLTMPVFEHDAAWMIVCTACTTNSTTTAHPHPTLMLRSLEAGSSCSSVCPRHWCGPQLALPPPITQKREGQ